MSGVSGSSIEGRGAVGERPDGSRDALEAGGSGCRSEKQPLWLRPVLRQFARPEGVLGGVVGRVMASKQDGIRRSRWTVELLEIGARDAALEVGCGPGLGLEAACRAASAGRVVGVDHSAVMIRMAGRRLRSHVVARRLELVRLAASEVPTLGRDFDRIFAVNCAHFWDDPGSVLRSLAAMLRPGGRLAITFQPPWPGAGSVDARRAGDETASLLRAAGLVSVRVEMLTLDGAPASCALGEREAS